MGVVTVDMHKLNAFIFFKWSFLPSVERGREAEQRAEAHGHEQGAEHRDHGGQSQTPLRLHHVDRS